MRACQLAAVLSVFSVLPFSINIISDKGKNPALVSLSKVFVQRLDKHETLTRTRSPSDKYGRKEIQIVEEIVRQSVDFNVGYLEISQDINGKKEVLVPSSVGKKLSLYPLGVSKIRSRVSVTCY